jgi:hypothetical protein
MARGFQKLIDRFGESTEDGDSFAEIPPNYMCDFYCGVMQFLGVILHHGLLTTEQYVQFASTLLTSFYGIPGRVGVWQELERLHPQSELKIPESHWQIHERSWVLLYQGWCLLDLSGPTAGETRKLRWRLAAVARRILQVIGGIGQLHHCAAFLQKEAEQLWPEVMGRPSYDTLETVLLEASEHYDIVLLEKELRLIGARAVVVKQQDTTCPDLHVTIPLSRTVADHLLNAFQGFVKINRTRPGVRTVRAQFMGSSGKSEKYERTIILLYEISERSLLYAVRRKAPGESYMYEVAVELELVSLEELFDFRSFEHVLGWPRKTQISI